MSDRSKERAESAIATFMDATASGSKPDKAALAAVERHQVESGMEGDLGIQTWHVLYSLIGYSDDRGFFRDTVFGPPQAGGPKVHKLVAGIRAMCAAKDIDFDELYKDACTERENLDPVTPSF
jgi:hypothetical protein